MLFTRILLFLFAALISSAATILPRNSCGSGQKEACCTSFSLITLLGLDCTILSCTQANACCPYNDQTGINLNLCLAL